MTVDLPHRVELLLARPYPTGKDVEHLCREARLHNYRSVTVPSSLTAHAYELLSDTNIKVCCLIGYPFGHSEPDVKRYETEVAVDFGAHEIELVPSLSRLAEGNYKFVLREIRDVVDAADERSVRVAIELPLWSDEQLAEIVGMILESGAQFATTSIAPPGRAITAAEIAKLRSLTGPQFGLKIGGLRDLSGGPELVGAGADRLGLLL